MTRDLRCSNCAGLGYFASSDPGSRAWVCESCDGTGTRIVPCALCGGDGGFDEYDRWTPCVGCGGTGEDEVETTLVSEDDVREAQ